MVCDLEPTQHMKISVADGKTLTSNEKCRVQFRLQGHQLSTEMRLITLKGCDAVLGIQWLKTLGPITLDFENMVMEFQVQNKPIIIQGESSTSLAAVSIMTREQLQEACRRDQCIFLGYLYALEIKETSLLSFNIIVMCL